MNDKTLARLTDRFAATTEPHAVDDAEENAGAFGYLRGTRERALMLELRRKDGSVVAFSYALLDRASYDPSDGIRLHFAGHQVHISGQSLNQPINSGGRSLFDSILRHRATWIQEAGRADLMKSQQGVPIIESILIAG